jgi:hypothetical protein
MLHAHIRNLCVHDSVGARVLVHLDGIPEPLNGFVEAANFSENCALGEIRYTVVMSQTCPEFSTIERDPRTGDWRRMRPRSWWQMLCCVGRSKKTKENTLMESTPSASSADSDEDEQHEQHEQHNTGLVRLRNVSPLHLTFIRPGPTVYGTFVARKSNGSAATVPVRLGWLRWRCLNISIFFYTLELPVWLRWVTGHSSSRGTRQPHKTRKGYCASLLRCCDRCWSPLWYPVLGSWHLELIDEAAAHADVLFADKILPDLDAYVQQISDLVASSSKLEEEEQELLVCKSVQEEAPTACCCCCCPPWNCFRCFRCFNCGWRWAVAPFRRCFLRRKLRKVREGMRVNLMELALVETVDAPTRRRLKEEEMLSEELGGNHTSDKGKKQGMLNQALFDNFVREERPQETEASAMSTLGVWASYVYIGMLTWFTVAFCIFMEQSEALKWMWSFFTAFLVTLFIFTPLTIFFNQVLLPFIVVDNIVLPELERLAEAQEPTRMETTRASFQLV